jgi:hypothetical protein
MRMNAFLSAVFLLALVCTSRGQFRADFFQDETYWGDGKAEFSTYDAQQVRYGQPRPSEVLHILVREPFSNREVVKAEPGSAGGSYPVIKLNQILRIPTGVYVYQQMHSAFWRADSGRLVKATLTSNDSCGNTYKEFRALAGLLAWVGAGWRYEWRTYWEGMSAGNETVRGGKDAIFYDELPVRVRTIDFAKGSGEFVVPLAPTIIRSKKDDVKFSPATVKWVAGAQTIDVEVAHAAGTDRFTLETKAPHLLREWQQADGGRLKLRKSLKLDYWNHNKLGDEGRLSATARE